MKFASRYDRSIEGRVLWIRKVLRKGGRKVDKTVMRSMDERNEGIEVVRKYVCECM